MCLFKLIRTKLENQFLSCTSHISSLISHMGSSFTILHSVVIQHVHHHRKSYWTVLIQSEEKDLGLNSLYFLKFG